MSYGLWALGFAELSDQGREHAGDAVDFGRKVLVLGLWKVSEIVGESQVVVELGGGALGDVQKASQLRVSVAAAPFGDVGRN
jgi:hypothetical protein